MKLLGRNAAGSSSRIAPELIAHGSKQSVVLPRTRWFPERALQPNPRSEEGCRLCGAVVHGLVGSSPTDARFLRVLNAWRTKPESFSARRDVANYTVVHRTTLCGNDCVITAENVATQHRRHSNACYVHHVISEPFSWLSKFSKTDSLQQYRSSAGTMVAWFLRTVDVMQWNGWARTEKNEWKATSGMKSEERACGKGVRHTHTHTLSGVFAVLYDTRTELTTKFSCYYFKLRDNINFTV